MLEATAQRVTSGQGNDVVTGAKRRHGMYDLSSSIVDYEMGSLSDEQVIELFQWLVDSGMAWTLQGHYGRTARILIAEGFIRHPGGHHERVDG